MQARSKQKRKQPERLASKLLEIRERLELSQGGMLRQLGLEDELERDYISKYERGVLEPPLHVLLSYARAIGISTDVLIDDELDLPAR
jgi:transcriptional regulator with XRE-family HTH domain